MAVLLSGTTIGGHVAVHANNISTYALTSLPSHNHDDRYFTESESDGRFFFAQSSQLANTNLNDLTTRGVYYSADQYGTNENIPFANYFTMINLTNDSGRQAQLWFGDTPGTAYWRPRQGSSTWHPWETIITSNNIGSQSVSYATSAGNSATTSQRSFDYLYTTSYLESAGAVYGTIFYDNNDRNFYLDPNGGSRLNAITYDNLYWAGDTTYGFIGRNVYADTVNGRGTDPLELNYYDGGPVKIGSGTYGSKELYASMVYVSSGNAVIHAGNIGSQSVNYAATAGNADTVDGRHADYFYPNNTDNGYSAGDINGNTTHQRLWGTDSVQNLLAFRPPTSIEYSTDGTNWTATTATTGLWDNKMFGKWGGFNMAVGNNVGGWRYVRMTWVNFGYHFFSHFTLAHSTNGHSFNFVFQKSDLNGVFSGEAFRQNGISSWPGYTFTKHSNVSGWWDTRDIRFVFELNHSGDPNNSISIGHIGLMGGYSGFTRLYDWDADRNMFFGNIVYAAGGNSSQWNSAFGWGNHASAGYQAASTAINTSNIGSQSVSYATTAGTANSVAWTNVSSRPTALSQFTNDLGNYGGWITTDGRAYPRRSDGTNINFYWDGQGGQPTWLWGSNNGTDFYVWNPSNFSVNYATTAGSANAVAWDNVSSKPATFPPSSHTHDDRYYTETESDGRYLRSDIYNSNYGGLQVFRNIGTIDGSWPDSDHTFGLENSDAGNIVVNFHRAGYTSNNLWYNGSQFRFDQVVTSTADFRAPIFYDSQDTNWYVDPNSTTKLKGFQTWHGGTSYYTAFNATNEINHYDSSNNPAQMYLNWNGGAVNLSNNSLIADDGIATASASMRAPIFYDSQDTTYYLDPNSTSRSFRGRGEILLGPNTSGEYTRIGGNGGAVDYATMSSSNGNLHIDCKDGFGLYLNYYSRDTIYLGQSGAITSDGAYYNGTAAAANSVAWGNVSSKPSYIMYYQGFTLDANTMDTNSTGFTYANNAPFYGPIARFSAGGGYDLWIGGSYNNSTGAFFLRTRNGDNATLNEWREIIHSGNIGSQSVNYASSAGNADTLDSLDSSEFARGRASYQVLNLDTIKQPGLYQYDGGIGGTQPEGSDQANLRTIEIGSGGRYSQMAFDWASEQAWFRRQTGDTWSTWREFIHSGNIASQSVSYATSAGNSDTVDSIHASSFVRNDATSQYLRAYYQYGSYLTTERPIDLRNQMGGSGMRVDFMNNGGGGNWNHVITFSGYDAYNMYQLGGYYDGGSTTNLYVRSEANHGTTSWTAWRRLLNEVADPYAVNMNQYVRTTDNVSFNALSLPNDSRIIINGETDTWGIRFRTTVSTTNLGGQLKNVFWNGGGVNEGIAFTGVGTGGTAMEINNNGTVWAKESFRAPIFYDSQNTVYYGDFASTSVMNAIRLGTSTNNGTISGGGDWGVRFANDNGWIQFGPANNSWTHIYSDKNFYFNQDLYVNNTRVVLNSGTWGINISGNAASASSVAWSNVSSKPANWLNATNLIEGFEPSGTAKPSGFYESYLGSGNPTGTWFNFINVRHSNPDNGHGFQIGMSYYDNNLWFRSYQGSTSPSFQSWSRALGTNTDPIPSNMDQYVRTTDNVIFNTTTSPTILVNNHSDNTKGYRIYNTSNSSVSAMFVNSSNQLVIAAGAVDQINLNKKVYVNGVALGVNVAPSATAGRIDASNDIVAYSSSDERLKHNITPIENALDKVKSLTGVEFDWKPEYKQAHGYEGHDTGIIAQQVQEVIPSAVRTNDTGFLAVRYEKLIGLLIEANKELAARVEELEKKLN